MNTAADAMSIVAAQPARGINTRQLQALALLLGACLLAHSAWMPAILTGYLATLIGLRLAWHLTVARDVPILVRAPLFLLTFVAIFMTAGTPLGRDGGAALLLGLAVLKLIETRNVRDGRVLCASVFFIAMTEFLFSQGLIISIYLGFLVVAVFAVLTLLRKYPDPTESNQTLGQRLSRVVLKSVGRIALAALPLAAAAFLFFPRLAEPLWGAPWRSAEGRSGIGDEMRPGMLSKLWLDDSPAFRVSFSGPVPQTRDLYWRGPVLWSFDGETWSRARWQTGGDVIPFRYDPDSVVSYEVLLEATEQSWYFPLDLPLRAVDGASLLADGQMVTAKPIISPKRLSIESATRFVFEDTPVVGHHYAALQLPPDSNPRAVALAESWRDQGLGKHEIIGAALKMFNASFTYSLEPPPLAPGRSVDDFLFETKTGYCEHFASSFTFLMRAAGIPARVVTGYQGGYWNESGAYLIVRKSDAHAWSEVWLQGRGWVRTDPTSAVAPERINRGNNADALPAAARWYHVDWAARWLDRADLISRWWRQRVVDFDSLRQRQLLTPFGVPDADTEHLIAILAILCACAMALGVWWSMRGLRKRGHDPLLRAWRKFGQTLAHAGVERGIEEGPMHYSQRAARKLPHAAGSILSLGKEFVRLRYGPGVETDHMARERLQRALRRFKVIAKG